MQPIPTRPLHQSHQSLKLASPGPTSRNKPIRPTASTAPTPHPSSPSSSTPVEAPKKSPTHDPIGIDLSGFSDIGLIDTITIAVNAELEDADIQRLRHVFRNRIIRDKRDGDARTIIPEGVRIWRSSLGRDLSRPLTRVQFSLPRVLGRCDDVTSISPAEVLGKTLTVMEDYVPATIAAARTAATISTSSIPHLLGGWWLCRLDLTRDADAPVRHIRNAFGESSFPGAYCPPDREGAHDSLRWKGSTKTVHSYDLGSRQRSTIGKIHRQSARTCVPVRLEKPFEIGKRLRVEVQCNAEKLKQFAVEAGTFGDLPALPVRLPAEGVATRIGWIPLDYASLHRRFIAEIANLLATVPPGVGNSPVNMPGCDPTSTLRSALVYLLSDSTAPLSRSFRLQVADMALGSKMKKTFQNYVALANKLARSQVRRSLASWLYPKEVLSGCEPAKSMALPSTSEPISAMEALKRFRSRTLRRA
jgi:hypothetical protein